jgi:hypothetical protein
MHSGRDATQVGGLELTLFLFSPLTFSSKGRILKLPVAAMRGVKRDLG